jgi:predicted anti-sigma-YlaC factor YlaD
MSDNEDMSCARWQEAISARLDGEDPGIEPRLLDAHLAACADCRRFEAAIDAGLRTARLQPAATMPDLSTPMAKLNAAADRAASWSIVRILLALVAFDVIFFAIRDLVLGSESDAGVHAARHLGAFSVAYGVGLIVVVVRPARARTMLPVAAVLAGALSITALIDLLNGRVPLLGEATHLPELISVLLLWLLANPRTPKSQSAKKSDRRLHAA